MSSPSLHVVFPVEDWPGWSIPSLDMRLESEETTTTTTAILSGQRNSATISVDSEVHSDYSCDSPIFLSRSAKRALKFAMRTDLLDDLRREAFVYDEPLLELQGQSIPRCFGLFTGTSPDSGEEIGCLVLELCEGCIDTPFDKLGVNIR